MFTTIVVGTDGSRSASEAVRRAARLAATSAARLHLVSAYRPATAPALEYAVGSLAVTVAPSELEAQAREHAAAVLADTSKAVGEEVVAVECHVRAGDAADVILDVAEEHGADLIVVGNRGMTGARRFLLGSVPNKVAHHARCDVLIASTT